MTRLPREGSTGWSSGSLLEAAARDVVSSHYPTCLLLFTASGISWYFEPMLNKNHLAAVFQSS